MAKKRDFTISDVYIMPKSILQGTASKEFVAEWKKDLKSGKWRKNYKKYLVVLLLFICLCSCSCVTRKGCERKFPIQLKDSTYVISKTLIVYRDTVINFHIEGDTITDTVFFKNDSFSKLRTKFATSYVSVKDGKLIHNLIQTDTSVTSIIKEAIRSSMILSERNTKKTIAPENSSECLKKNPYFINRLAITIITLIVLLLIFRYIYNNLI